MDVDLVVPGHGPITDRSSVGAVRAYLEWIDGPGAPGVAG
jgi:flavorubredoxin